MQSIPPRFLTKIVLEYKTNYFTQYHPPLTLQYFPFPTYPLRHVQLYDPRVLLQFALAWHLWLP